MPNIDLGTFSFDAGAVQKSLDDIKKRMFNLKQEMQSYRDENRELNKAIKERIKVQQQLVKSGQKESKQYNQLEKEIESLTKQKEDLYKQEIDTRKALKDTNKEYRETIKVVEQLTDENGDLVSSYEAINAVIDKENRTINEARANNKQLLALRNEIDVKTDEGAAAMERLNDKLNENNQFVTESVSGYEQQKINIGNYEGAVDRALGPVGEFLTLSKEAGGVMPLLKNGLSAVTSGIGGMTKAAISFIATPVGAVIAVLAAGFLLFQNALNRSEETTNKFKRALAPLSGLFNRVLEALEPIGEFLVDGLVLALEVAEMAFYNMLDSVTAALDYLGFEDAADSVNSFKKEIQETAQASRELADAEAELEKAQRKARLTQLEYQKQAEEFRQIRDDESRSIQERIEANRKLGAVLEEQLKKELEIAQTALRVANLRIEQEGRTKETLDAQYEALTEIADIEERITGQRSEQLTNENSLRKEALDLIKERQDAAIEANEKELELYLAQQGIFKKSMEEQLRIYEETRNKELDILEEKREFGKVTETEYQTDLLNIKNQFLENQRDLVIENAERERDELLRQIGLRKTDYANFTQDKLDFEIQNSQDILSAEQEAFQQKLDQGIINEQQYQDEMQRIRDEARVREDEARMVWEEANKERELIDAENQRIIDEENFLNEWEIKQQRLDVQRQQEIEAARQTGADIALIEKKFAEREKKIEKEKEDAKVQMTADTYGSIASILGEQTAAGKAFALAQALINTYQGISAGVALGFPAAIPAVAAATATGFGAVKNIAKTKAEKGYVSDGRGKLLRGKRHSGGGINVEAEDGEPILTRGAWKLFPELISDINVAGGGVPLMARGGVAGSPSSSNAMVQRNIFNQIDMTQFSESITEGVRQGAMEGSATGSAKGSQQGITNLSENRQIQTTSAF